MRSNSLYKFFSLFVAATMLAGLVGSVTPQAVHAANLAPVQVFYLPFPEDQMFASYVLINTTNNNTNTC